MNARLITLPGDGIGPEVVAEAVSVLRHVAARCGHDFTFTEQLIGGCSIERFGAALTPEALEACKRSDGVLLGAVGGPRWDDPSAGVRPEQGLLALRKGLGLYANLRPVKARPGLLEASPLRPERVEGVDLIVVRELTGGLYFGRPQGETIVDGTVHAVDTLEYSETEIRRIADLAFRLARSRRRRVTSVDKANVLASSRLWRRTVNEVARGYADVALDHMLVDTAAMRLITSARTFDVMVTENMFGDILTDEASVLTGSIGLLPSASIGSGGPGVFEPIHGSAPDIAGKGRANPVGTILSAALLLRYSLGLEREALLVEEAVASALREGARTPDLGGALTTSEMSAAVIQQLSIHMGR